jgi:hypothetical protein
MIRLLFVGDGERDAATNPPIVKTIVRSEIRDSHQAWKDIRLGRGGYGRKLRFATRAARDAGVDGLVATVDQDRSARGERLRELAAARREDRETAAPLPTALGCAIPHAEAWLLDDVVAVRTVLRLDHATVVPNLRDMKYPKDELTALHAGSPRAEEPILILLAEIAQAVLATRCQHANETGFAAFVEEIRDEIAPLLK